MTNFSIIVIGLILKYLFTLSLVSYWSDVSKNLHKDGHWFADIVLLIFWYVYISSIKFLIFLHRRFGRGGTRWVKGADDREFDFAD